MNFDGQLAAGLREANMHMADIQIGPFKNKQKDIA